MFELFATLDEKGAELSPDGVYRYTLTREWEDGRCVCWLMFNPSTADATLNDATIREVHRVLQGAGDTDGSLSSTCTHSGAAIREPSSEPEPPQQSAL